MNCAYDVLLLFLLFVLELILAGEGFPAETEEGKFVQLHQRILAWEERYGAESIAKSLMAVKWIGNISSHESSLSLDQVLDAYEILERLLEQLFPPDSTHLDELADQVNQTKGRST